MGQQVFPSSRKSGRLEGRVLHRGTSCAPAPAAIEMLFSLRSFSMATTHKVEQGECLSSVAKKYGFANWRTIYQHPQNAEFREKRPNPNIIYPGDLIFIPDPELKEKSVQTEKRHELKTNGPKTLLRLV